MSELVRLHMRRMIGHEPLTRAGSRIGPAISEFWGWSMSDLVENTSRGVFAEFIVAVALGIRTDAVRVAWAPYDLETAAGIKVEVKSAAYLQSWWQRELSTIQFSIKPAHPYDPDTGTSAPEKTRSADVYVFCLLAHTDKATVDPMSMDQWKFYVVARSTLDQRKRSQTSITLRSLEELSPVFAFEDLAAGVDAAAGLPERPNRPRLQATPAE